jgi:hypothetical protein
MENKNTITNRIAELEIEAQRAQGLAALSRINIELDNLREQQSENMMLGEYESGCDVETYQRQRFARW